MRTPLQNPRKPATAADDAVGAARTQARRRLIGALVLLTAGVIGFPLLFETQPRPLPIDTPIVAAAREPGMQPVRPGTPRAGVVAPPVAPAPGGGSESVAAPPPTPAAASAASAAVPTALAAASTAAGATSLPAAGAASGAAPAPAPAPARSASLPLPAARGAAASATVRTPSGAAVASAPGVAPAAPAPVARASEPRSAAPAAAAEARFVVQVGAYTDAATLREARQKVEKLGLKTYTQVIEGDASRRTRVRVGPFATRAEAQEALARLKAAGLPGNLLAL
jgi:DedD protein